MIIQALLSIGLFLVLVYSLTQIGSSPLVGIVAALVAAAGIYLIWLPEHSNILANWLGIGRGADLLEYCWIVISMAFILNLHFKMRRSHDLMTELTRSVAIAEAERENKTPLESVDSTVSKLC